MNDQTEQMPSLDDGPTYTFAGHVLAGYHAHSLPPRLYRASERENRDAGHAGTFTDYRPVARFTRAQIADLCRSVRTALAGDDGKVRMSARDCKRAVLTLATLRSAPERVAARERVLALAASGDVPRTMGATPDPWMARQHETTAKRTRKGATVSEVKRYGNATVNGGTHRVAPTDPDAAGTDDAVLAWKMAATELSSGHVRAENGRTVYGARRVQTGRVALDVTHVADRCYGHLGLPALDGTDVRQFVQVVTAPDGVDPSRCRVAFRRAYVGDTDGQTVNVDDRTVYGANTRHTYHRVTRASRTRIPRPRRRAVDLVPTYRPSRLYAIHAPYTAPVLATACRIALLAPSDDRGRMFVGHQLHDRPSNRDARGHRQSTVRRERSMVATARKRARNIGTVPCATEQGIREALANLNRGEAMTLRTPSGDIVANRANDGRYFAVDGRDENVTPVRHRVRTADALAKRLA